MTAPRRIAILGAGREGQAAQRWCEQRWPEANVLVFDDADATRLPPQGAQWKGFEQVIVSPGIAPHHPAWREAVQRGLKVTSGTQLWFDSAVGGTTVVVTGTKGKSTTAAALAHVLSNAGAGAVTLAGNIGTPLLELPTATDGDIHVIELSSYQLHGLTFRCSVAVVLNLFPEHLDWHGCVENYYQCKLTALQAADRPMANAANDALRQRADSTVDWFNCRAGFHLRGNQVYCAEQALGTLHTRLMGVHNQQNMVAVIAAAAAIGVAPGESLQHLKRFEPLPHRLHCLGERGRLKWVDDSISTTPQSTLAAALAMGSERLTLLVGGFDRGLDWSGFIADVPSNVDLIIGMGKQGRRIVEAVASGGAPVRVEVARDLPEAVAIAIDQSIPGATVVLSPGAPSYGEFKDFRHRGNAFRQLAGFADTRAQP